MPAKRTYPQMENCSTKELDVAIKCAPTQRSCLRLQAIKALALEAEFTFVSKLHCVHPNTLSRWVSLFNKQGIDGLIERARCGRPRKISPDDSVKIVELLEDPDKAQVVHWTGKKLHGYLRQNLKLQVGYSTLIRFIHEKNYRLKVPQPWPDRQDEKARTAFCVRLRQWLADRNIELWFSDETGIEGDPRPRRRWIKVGKTGRVCKNGDHLRMNVTGMVCPRTGEVFFIEFSHSDTEMFQIFLNEANHSLNFQRARNLLIVDNASWHKSKSLDWGRFEPVFLPSYSPDLNPIERLWLLIKQEWLSDFVAKDHDELIARVSQALIWAIERGPANSKTCSIKTKL